VLGPAERRGGHAALLAWLDQHTSRLFLPTVCVAEIAGGIAKLRRQGSTRKAAAFEEWLGSVLYLHAGSILPLDVAAAHETGLIADRARALGLSPGFADLCIAGIAAAHRLTVLTRNLRHFTPLGVPAFDPFAALPA
jgi:hypothetical protein